MCGGLQHLDLGKTYVHWKQGHPQAAAQEAHDDASDVSSEEGVNAASDSGMPCSRTSTCLLGPIRSCDTSLPSSHGVAPLRPQGLSRRDRLDCESCISCNIE